MSKGKQKYHINVSTGFFLLLLSYFQKSIFQKRINTVCHSVIVDDSSIFLLWAISLTLLFWVLQQRTVLPAGNEIKNLLTTSIRWGKFSVQSTASVFVKFHTASRIGTILVLHRPKLHIDSLVGAVSRFQNKHFLDLQWLRIRVELPLLLPLQQTLYS